MTTFKEISGQLIRTLSSDPANPQIGQIWYNSTIGVLKGYRSLGGAWASGGNLSTARSGLGGFGIQTAAVGTGGDSPSVTNVTEEYNGSTWSGGGNLNTSRGSLIAGAGTLTAGMIAGGYIATPTENTKATEEYDGSAWTNGGNMGRSPASRATTVSGTQTAGLAFGGLLNPAPPPASTAATEEYDGSAWTSGGNMNVSTVNRAGAGTQSASFAAGKEPTGAESETYDGTSWTTITGMNTARQAGEASGNSSAGLVFGGNSPAGVPVVGILTESWNGSTWTNQNNLSIGRRNHGTASQGSVTSALGFAGYSTANTAATEEWTDPTFATQTLTTS